MSDIFNLFPLPAGERSFDIQTCQNEVDVIKRIIESSDICDDHREMIFSFLDRR